jgi:hypothetical protein
MIEFETAIQTLCDAEVDFVVIGSFSAILHGSVSVTLTLTYAIRVLLRTCVAWRWRLRPSNLAPGVSQKTCRS